MRSHLRHLNSHSLTCYHHANVHIKLQVYHPFIITSTTGQRTLSTAPLLQKKALPPRPTLPDADLKHAYLKGSGPGGQKINKTSSAVQLTHLPTGTVVKSQATRSRSQNHTIARRILAEKIELLERGGESRAAKVVERKRDRKRSREKKARRKYRLLEGGKQNGVNGAFRGAIGVGATEHLRAGMQGEVEDPEDGIDVDEESIGEDDILSEEGEKLSEEEHVRTRKEDHGMK